MLVEAEAAEQSIAELRAEPRGVIRMACPVALLQFQFSKLIARFVKANPAVEIHLKSFNRPVDVIAEGFDLAIRVRFRGCAEFCVTGVGVTAAAACLRS